MTPLEQALKFTLAWEGGYVNDPDDPGGATNFGVTQAVYNARRKLCGLPTRSVRFITQGEIQNIYMHGYWKPAGCDAMPLALAIVVFDTAVNFGVGRAKEFLRKIPVPLTDPFCDGKEAAAKIVAMRKAYRYKRVTTKPSQIKFLKGWLNRDGALLAVVQ